MRLPGDVQYSAEHSGVNSVKPSNVGFIQRPGFRSIQQDGLNCCSEDFDLDPPGHVRFPEYIEGLKSLPSQRFSDQYVFRRRSNIGAKVFEVIYLIQPPPPLN